MSGRLSEGKKVPRRLDQGNTQGVGRDRYVSPTLAERLALDLPKEGHGPIHETLSTENFKFW